MRCVQSHPGERPCCTGRAYPGLVRPGGSRDLLTHPRSATRIACRGTSIGRWIGCVMPVCSVQRLSVAPYHLSKNRDVNKAHREIAQVGLPVGQRFGNGRLNAFFARVPANGLHDIIPVKDLDRNGAVAGFALFHSLGGLVLGVDPALEHQPLARIRGLVWVDWQSVLFLGLRGGPLSQDASVGLGDAGLVASHVSGAPSGHSETVRMGPTPCGRVVAP